MRRLLVPFVFLLFSFVHGDRIAVADSQQTAADSILQAWLKTQAVENEMPQFKSLWLFVSDKEFDSVQESHQLLRTFAPATLAEAAYFSTLGETQFDKQPLARLLRGTGKLRIHDAWPSYWPLINEDRNGDLLVQFFLEDSALLVEFLPGAKNPFTVYDKNGTIIPLPEAMARERHIAVVFMNGKGEGFSAGENMRKDCRQRRSFYLVNEKMIHHWQHATPLMQDGILRDLNYLLLLEAWTKEHVTMKAQTGRKGAAVLKAWNLPAEKRTVLQQFFACRRTAEAIEATPGELQKMIAGIRRIWPLQVRTVVKFPARGIR